jgi:hypothetical protein
VARAVVERLNDEFTYRGQQATWKQCIFFECRRLAGFLRGVRPRFHPYVHRWA